MRAIFVFWLLFGIAATSNAQFSNNAYWISTMESQSASNTWLGYRKTFRLDEIPAASKVRIAVDSKYWLWINGEPVVFEGGLKRGPNPYDTYYDEVDLSRYLKKGENLIAVLVWYFGKDGFSHKSSGKAALLFDSDFGVVSNDGWECSVLSAFGTAGAPYPNFRLPESSIRYDARKDIGAWYVPGYNRRLAQAQVIGRVGDRPWNVLVKRPIPLWKDHGLRPFAGAPVLPFTGIGDTLVLELPYNAQITPYLEVEAEAGKTITIFTDNYLTYHGAASNVRAEYVTRTGIQQYESFGWVNGHKVYFVIPAGVRVLDMQYRETGYDTDFAGSFNCADPFFNQLWEKAIRTLYLNMRDSYMDCPERERAQWTGDAVNQSGQAFYALSTSSHALSRKWLRELIGWQQEDGSIYAPVPAGNWVKELPCQSAASIGYYGLWNYYLHSGDRQTLSDLYEGAKRYLSLWAKEDDGTVKLRAGGWTWGDWGDNRDMLLIYNLWYYLGMKGMHLAALELKKSADVAAYEQDMGRFKSAFNNRFWTGTAYRDPAYTDQTDDRVQALAVVSGIAAKNKYPAILSVFQQEEHASPYMEKYVFEAMFQMGYEQEALDRHKKRFASMVNDHRFTTLFEGWGIGNDGYGGGTVNHSWSGGGLTVLSQYVCGIMPLTPGYKTFRVLPKPGNLSNARAKITSVAGIIEAGFEQSAKKFVLTVVVPEQTSAVIGIPAEGMKKVYANGKLIWDNGKYQKGKFITADYFDSDYIRFGADAGNWRFEGIR